MKLVIKNTRCGFTVNKKIKHRFLLIIDNGFTFLVLILLIYKIEKAFEN
jgi:hypothetical protein